MYIWHLYMRMYMCIYGHNIRMSVLRCEAHLNELKPNLTYFEEDDSSMFSLNIIFNLVCVLFLLWNSIIVIRIIIAEGN